MLPTLRDGDVLLVRRRTTARPGDIVVVTLPGARPLAVKRLAFADGEGWWVERDNPDEGVDSWAVGPVPPDGLHGVVVLRCWPRPARLLRARPPV